jgi:hypothetical protein
LRKRSRARPAGGARSSLHGAHALALDRRGTRSPSPTRWQRTRAPTCASSGRASPACRRPTSACAPG